MIIALIPASGGYKQQAGYTAVFIDSWQAFSYTHVQNKDWLTLSIIEHIVCNCDPYFPDMMR